MAADTKSRFRIFRTRLRASRAYFVQLTSATAITAFFTLAPRIPAMAMANTIPGKETIMSATRMMMVSTQPPK